VKESAVYQVKCAGCGREYWTNETPRRDAFLCSAPCAYLYIAASFGEPQTGGMPLAK
jgi:endogenous inhibitor of DNA gyrase (YacG/DUF329 family)